MRIRTKLENYAQVDVVLDELIAVLGEEQAARKPEVKSIFHDLQEKVLREEILERSIRLDGRRFDEIRPITIETSVLPRVHGSVVFTRGETQALVSATLGTSDDQQKIEHVDGETTSASCSTTTSRRSRSAKCSSCAGRAAAKSATAPSPSGRSTPVIPTEEQFPYTLRIVSDILESNGSSSMASVCGGSLAMMDAGVPLKSPVAGVAMGLILDEAKASTRC